MSRTEGPGQRFLLAALATTLLFPLPAVAQQSTSGQPVTLPPVTVTESAEQPNGPVQGYVARESATASKTGASIIETPQSVTVIGREELSDRNVQSVTQAVGYTPGVFASTSAISQRFDYFSIRGFDATNTGTVLDGLRSTTNQSYVRYQPYGMERVEVLRGPSSFLFGGNSLGGTVNLVSKRPTAETLREVGVQFGNHGRLQGQFDLSGAADKDKTLLYRLVGVGRDSETQFDGVPDDTGYIAPSLTWRPNADTSLTLLSSYSRDEFGPPRPFLPLKGSLQANPNGALPRNLYLDGKGLENNNTQVNFGYSLDHAISDGWSLQSSARYTYNDLMTQTFSGLALAADNRTLNRRAYEFGITGRVFATDNSVRKDWDAGLLRGTSTVGLSYRHTGEEYYLNTGAAPAIDIYAPVYGGAFAANTPFTKTDQTGHEAGLYVANTVHLADRFVVDLAGRRDWVSVDTDNLLTNRNTSQQDQASTYRVGLTYLAGWGLAPYTSYATSFSPVLGTNVYGDAYKPTEGKQFEAGIKYQPDFADALFTAAYYDLTQTNVSTADPNNALNTLQTGEVQSRGIELSATVSLMPGLKTVASYTYNDQEVTATTTAQALGKRPTAQPEQMISLWGDYTVQDGPLAGLGFGGGGRYVGSTYADAANQIRVPSYTLFDAAIRYDLSGVDSSLSGLKLALNVNNLFDKEYYVSCSSTSCNEGYGRTVLGTVSYRW